jgi:hypothetical protein
VTATTESSPGAPKTITAAFEMVNAARILLYAAAEAIDSIVADYTDAGTSIGEAANQLQDVINAGEVELRCYIQAGR